MTLTGRISSASPSSPQSYQVQAAVAHGAWRTLATHISKGSFITSVAFRTANTYYVRIAVPRQHGHSAATSRTMAIRSVAPSQAVHYPAVTVQGNVWTIQHSAADAYQMRIGNAFIDPSITTCYTPDVCNTDTAAHGSYVTLPLTITVLRGTVDYNTLNYQLKTPDGQIFQEAFEDTLHGQLLHSGTLTIPGDTVTGDVVFDAPYTAGQTRLMISDYITEFLGYDYF